MDIEQGSNPSVSPQVPPDGTSNGHASQTIHPNQPKPLRLWPGVAAAVLLFLVRFVMPEVVSGTLAHGIMGSLACGAIIVLWWAFFSRVPHLERWGGLLLMVAATALTYHTIHESIATAMMGLMFFIFAIPIVTLSLVLWAVTTSGLSAGPRRAALVAIVLVACGGWNLLRSNGIDGDAAADFRWRWTQTDEEKLLAQFGDESMVKSSPRTETPGSAAGVEAAWPGFRGPARDGIVPSVRIDTDWSASPPQELWRRQVGPAWSSFAVRGEQVYTQEQRGEEEVVTCYNLATGEPEWRHSDTTRFWEANAGAGPRATPTISGDRIYTFGGTGILNVLDAGDGSVIWSRNAGEDTEVEVPFWGFSGSPLVVGDVVIVAAAGVLAAYDLNTGEPRWTGPAGGNGYSSPHHLTIDGVGQILLLSGTGATSVAPTDGKVLWAHEWPGFSMVQPALTTDGDILLGAGEGVGIRRIAVARGPEGWTTEERWTSARLKPYFNDFVLHEGHAFGFDGRILACIDLKDGERKWKGGRYGHGQLVLLAEQGLLLVLSEKGELALVKASPEGFTELSRVPAIEGKTWNHPVLVDDVLLVRNAQEMVAFRLSLAGG